MSQYVPFCLEVIGVGGGEGLFCFPLLATEIVLTNILPLTNSDQKSSFPSWSLQQHRPIRVIDCLGLEKNPLTFSVDRERLYRYRERERESRIFALGKTMPRLLSFSLTILNLSPVLPENSDREEIPPTFCVSSKTVYHKDLPFPCDLDKTQSPLMTFSWLSEDLGVALLFTCDKAKHRPFCFCLNLLTRLYSAPPTSCSLSHDWLAEIRIVCPPETG